MRLLIPLILLLVLVGSAARAQPGVRAGAGFATLSTFNLNGAYREARAVGDFGFQAGVFYER